MWVGSELPRIAWLSLSSAVHHGYKPHIYLYDESIKVPAGAIKCDANDIVHKDEIFLRQGRYTNFSDLFRYSLLSKISSIWFDLDCIFLNDKCPINEEYIFCYESYDPLVIAIGMLTYPPHSDLSQMVLGRCRSLLAKMQEDIDAGNWPILGPELFTKCAIDCSLEHHAKRQEFMYPIGWGRSELELLIKPELFHDGLMRIETPSRLEDNECSFFHVWASGIDMIFSQEEFNKFEEFPHGSLLWHYDQKFRINEIS